MSTGFNWQRPRSVLAVLTACALQVPNAIAQFSDAPARGQRASPTLRPGENAAPFKGDPLRAQSSVLVVAQGALYGDFGGDGDVDLEDYAVLRNCAGSSGVGIAALPPCDAFCWDDDNDVDLWEIAAFQNVFTGPERSPVCGNGVVESGEECDGGGETALCNSNCTTTRCGDGIVNTHAGEQCDITGACCDLLSGSCAEGVVSSECFGTHRAWTEGAACADVVCDAVTGACCDHDPFGACTDGVTRAACDCPTCDWVKLGSCSDLECSHVSTPAVGEWGLIVLALLLLIGAKLVFRRSNPPDAIGS